MSSDGEFTLAAAGDAIITRRLSTANEDRLTRIVDRIRDADAGFVNLETLLHDYEGYPAAETVANFSGTYMRAPPYVADELEWAGFDLFAAASNHSNDYSHGGMLTTMRELERRDLAYAGLGRNLADAREPAYVDTPGGRVALVAAASTINPGGEAGPGNEAFEGRPGVSPLRTRTRYVVSSDQLDQLQQISEDIGLEDVKRQRKNVGIPVDFDESDDTFYFLNAGKGHGEYLIFEEGDEAHGYQRTNGDDVREITARIREASRQADWVIASLHAHEGENATYNDTTVAPFIESFARKCVDAGADAFVGHGPHTLRGIEVYDGAPIFYSLGNFISQYDTITRLPEEAYNRYDLSEAEKTPATVHDLTLTRREYWEGVLPVVQYDDGKVVRIDLHPVDLGFDQEQPRHGMPLEADDETADDVLGRLSDLSDQYGTDVRIDGAKGVIEP